MMECPRCGFQQPEDRFCANCGLDIDSFRAKPKPLSQRLMGSPLFYGGVAVAAILVLIWWAKQAHITVPNLPRFGMEVTAPVTKTQLGEALPASSPPIGNQVTRPAAPAASSEAPAPTPETVIAPPARTAAPEAPAETLPVKMPTQLEVSFVELAKEAWTSIAAEGKGSGDSGSAHAVTFGSRDKLNGVLAVGRKLPGTRQMGVAPSSGAALHFQLGNSEPPLGFFFDITVVRQENGTVELEIAGQLDLKHDGAPETHQKVELTTQFAAGSGAVVVQGLLPRKPVPENLSVATQMSPLTALESADFLEGQSEFLLILQGK